RKAAGRPQKSPEKTSPVATISPEQTLADLGISRDQSSKWQQLAEVPEDKFEAALNTPGSLPSTDALIAKATSMPAIESDFPPTVTELAERDVCGAGARGRRSARARACQQFLESDPPPRPPNDLPAAGLPGAL